MFVAIVSNTLLSVSVERRDSFRKINPAHRRCGNVFEHHILTQRMRSNRACRDLQHTTVFSRQHARAPRFVRKRQADRRIEAAEQGAQTPGEHVQVHTSKAANSQRAPRIGLHVKRQRREPPGLRLQPVEQGERRRYASRLGKRKQDIADRYPWVFRRRLPSLCVPPHDLTSIVDSNITQGIARSLADHFGLKVFQGPGAWKANALYFS
jgi:hypothetical protein